jgi:hypothetical protein
VQIAQWHFSTFSEPRLVKAGFMPISKFQPQEPERMPSWAVLARADHREDWTLEEYVSGEGSIAKVEYKSHQWASTHTECEIVNHQNQVALAGLFLFILGGLLRFLRTGKWNSMINWSGFSQSERILVVYGASILIASIAAPSVNCVI